MSTYWKADIFYLFLALRKFPCYFELLKTIQGHHLIYLFIFFITNEGTYFICEILCLKRPFDHLKNPLMGHCFFYVMVRIFVFVRRASKESVTSSLMPSTWISQQVTSQLQCGCPAILIPGYHCHGHHCCHHHCGYLFHQ